MFMYTDNFRDFKTSNILLDENWNGKLSDFGLARQGPSEGLSHVSTVMAWSKKISAETWMRHISAGKRLLRSSLFYSSNLREKPFPVPEHRLPQSSPLSTTCSNSQIQISLSKFSFLLFKTKEERFQ